jgi:hypothetical protein
MNDQPRFRPTFRILALLELQLSAWQELLAELTQANADPRQTAYCQSYIERLTKEVNGFQRLM